METVTTTLPIIALSSLAGNDLAGLNTLQQTLEPHLHLLIALWGAVWLTTIVWLLFALYRDRNTHS